MEDEDPPLSRGRSRSSYKDEVADEETIINIDTKQVDTEDGTPIPTLSSSSTNESDTSDRSEDSSSTPKDEDEDGNGPPMYDPNAVFDNDNIPDSADNFEGRNDEDDNEDDDDDEEEDDDDDEQLPRTRARSKSVFDPYGALENEKGVVLINPSVIEGIATKAAAEAAAATSPISSSGESPLIKQLSENRKGPLQMREVEALRKGVEEAIQPRNPDDVREEREEKMAAEEERRVRLSVQRESIKANDMSYRRLKLLMLGDTGVGKSSIMQRWTADSFHTDLMGTVGVNFKSRNVTVCGENINAQVWDTAGQERFHKITTSYYKASQGILLVFDVSNKKSQENIEYWVSNIKQFSSGSTQLVLVANKIDLRQSIPDSCLSTIEGLALAKQYDLPYFETSAKDDLHIHQAFHTLINNIQKAEIMALMNKTQSSGDHTGRRNSGSFFSSRPLSPRTSSMNGSTNGGSPRSGGSPTGMSNDNGGNTSGGCFIS